MNPTNQPVSFYGDNSRNTDGALLAALATKDYGYDEAAMIGAGGVCDLRNEVAEVKAEVKDAECNIRHDIGDTSANIRREVARSESEIRRDIMKEGQDAMAATKDAECRLSKEILETKHSLAKDILRSEYENKLAIQTAIKEINTEARHNAERTQDKIAHGFEEVNEKLCECCAEAAVVATRQDGFLNLLVDALKVK